MKRTIAILLSLFICMSSTSAFAHEIPSQIPDELSIREHWVSMTTSYDIETKTQKLGTLYRRFFSFLLTYDFYDPFENKIAYAKAKFFSFNAHFDVFGTNEEFLGAAEERLFAFFPTFDIYARDGYSKLAKASMNFWGTTFTIYDPVTDREMAHMSRPFFRIKNDWTFHVTDRMLFDQKGIDPRVLLTVLAFQGDREYWERERRDDDYNLRGATNSTDTAATSDVSPAQLNTQIEKIDAVSKQEGLDDNKAPDEKTVAAVAKELETEYNNTQSTDNSVQNSQEKISEFTDYCLQQAQSNTISNEKKQAILFLLKARLESVGK